jgi:hypothetical protein
VFLVFAGKKGERSNLGGGSPGVYTGKFDFQRGSPYKWEEPGTPRAIDTTISAGTAGKGEAK